MRGLWRQGADERGMVLVIALFIMAILLMTGVFLVRMSSTEGDIAYNAMYSEGSFYAADAAINVGLDLVTPTVTTAPIDCDAPPLLSCPTPFIYDGSVAFSGTTRLPGYSIGSGTGYNPGGFVFYTYLITGSGAGRRAQRQIDVQAAYGPVAQ